MKTRSIILLVGLALIAGAIATLPASFLRGTINNSLGGAARIENVEGTVWRGDAVIVFAQKQLPQTPVKWRFAASLLLSGAVGYEVNINQNNAQANTVFGTLIIGRSLHNLHLCDAVITAPAASILPLLNPALSFSGFSGQVRFSAANLTLQPNPTFDAAKIVGKASLNWRDANSFFLLGSAANDYQFEFDGRGAEASFNLKTLRGPLAAEGLGTWVLERSAPFNTVNFNGRAKIPQALLSRLGNVNVWLEKLGRMEGDQLTINWNGRF